MRAISRSPLFSELYPSMDAAYLATDGAGAPTTGWRRPPRIVPADEPIPPVTIPPELQHGVPEIEAATVQAVEAVGKELKNELRWKLESLGPDRSSADKISKFTSQKAQRERLEQRDFPQAAAAAAVGVDPMDVVVAEYRDEKITLRDTAALIARIEATREMNVGVALTATGARAAEVVVMGGGGGDGGGSGSGGGGGGASGSSSSSGSSSHRRRRSL